MLKVITVTTNIEETQPLINSLEKHGWDWTAIYTTWQGFGTKLIETYRYLKQAPEITDFIFCDAFDVVCLGAQIEFHEKLKTYSDPDFLVSAERGCWPPPLQQHEALYPHFEHGFNYLNSGCYYAKSTAFIALMEAYMPEHSTDDQMWFSERFLFNKEFDIKLDNNCVVFQSYSFLRDDDFDYGCERLFNNCTDTTPIFIHGNGRTNMDKVRELL